MPIGKPMIEVSGLSKTFVLHNQGGVRLPVFTSVDFTVTAGECVVLGGPSGAGKSTFMRSLTGNYLASSGTILVRHDEEMVDITTAAPRRILEVRRRTLGYVSQFLRVIPRVPTLEIVKEPMLASGVDEEAADRRAGTLLSRLNLPESLW